MTTTTNPGKVITGLVRFSYVHVFEAVALEEGQEKKFSVSLIIPKSDNETVDKINAAVEAIKAQVKAKNGGKLPAKFKLPLRDGDEERPDDEAYANSYFLNANCKPQPGVVGPLKDKDGKPLPITDPAQLYSGCYGRASINFYAFDTKGNKGIACGLNNLQKLRDGEHLGGRSRAEDDFSDDLPMDDGDLLD
ncbi:DUF2815 family protein [Chitinophaga rhizosphaerae]|uniref:DUF2815 family protein n=1 Tax=Chitinophaga rhizosphaerae TaxID=1864947 RepID=UPI000F80EC0D|nr:DUF2815 family protein [Chitinophaga rhizosphaerae]